MKKEYRLCGYASEDCVFHQVPLSHQGNTNVVCVECAEEISRLLAQWKEEVIP